MSKPDAYRDLPASNVRGISVHAQWDGVPEHAATVLISYTVFAISLPNSFLRSSHHQVEAIPNSRLGLIATQDPAISSQAIRATIRELVEDDVVSPGAVTHEAEQPSGSSQKCNHEALRELCLNNLPTTDSPKEYTSNLKENKGSSTSRYPQNGAFPAWASRGTSRPLSVPVRAPKLWPMEVRKQEEYRARREQGHGRETPTPMPKRPATLPRPRRSRHDRTDSPLPYALSLPSGSPKAWNNRLCSVQWFDRCTRYPGHAFEDAYVDELPLTVPDEERLHVCFPYGIMRGFYEVELHMGILLSQPDHLGWQSFRLPSLSMYPFTESSNLLEFSLSSTPGDSACSTQFQPTSLLVPRKEEDGLLQGDFLTGSQGVLLRVRSTLAVQRLERWNSTVLIYSTFSYEPELGVAIKYSISLSVAPQEECFTERVMLAVLIKNGPRNGGTYSLESGECVVHLARSAAPSSDTSVIRPSRTDDTPAANNLGGTVEVLIERDSGDLSKRFVLEFTRYYPDRGETSIHLPRITPKIGKVLSEKIWVLKPSPPLRLHAVPRPFLSTWQVNRRTIANREILCFDRIEVPALFPTAFTDDAVVQIRTFEATVFDAVLADASCMAIPSLRMDIDITAGKRLECRMSFLVEVGRHDNRLLQIDAYGWQAKHAMINNRFSSNHFAPWWNGNDMSMNLFKSSWMQPGQKLQVELCFIVNEHAGDRVTDQGDWVKVLYPLPRLTDKIVLRGDLNCTHNGAAVAVSCQILDEPQYQRFRFEQVSGNDRQLLPSLPRGYQLNLEYWMLDPPQPIRPRASKLEAWAGGIRFSGGLPLQPRAVRFDDENSEASNCGDDEDDGLEPEDNELGDSDDEGSVHNDGQGGSYGLDDTTFPINEDKQTPTAPTRNQDDKTITANADDSPSSSDEHASDRERENSPEEEQEEEEEDDDDDDDEQLAVVIHALRLGVAFDDYFIDPVWQLFRHLQRTSCTHFLVRVLFVEFIICACMPWAYFGGEPARAVRDVVGNMGREAAGIVLGDFEEGMWTTKYEEKPALVQDGEPAEEGSGVDKGGIGVTGEVRDGEGGDKEGRGGAGWRDRIDLALGWRPAVS
ncbi:MAG: hypothetical protein LQ346_007275 [Caloplaca aetnensis]|nr:MAG: hypothetical protein LQ346_007275 [Caloplaca aetnensis]